MLHNAVRGRDLKSGYKPSEQAQVLATFDQHTQNNIIGRVHEVIAKGELFYAMTNGLGIPDETAVDLIYPTTTPEVDFLCSPKWCGFWSECHMNNPSLAPQVDIVKMIGDLKEVQHYTQGV
jgi:hypothetical protein